MTQDLPNLAGARGLADYLVALRNARGLDQKRAALQGGIHPNTVGRLEHLEASDTVQLRTLVTLSAIWKVPIERLLLSYVAAVGSVTPISTKAVAAGHCARHRGNPRALGLLIGRIRLTRRWSQRDLALAAGTHTNYVNHIERGKTAAPTVRTVVRLAWALSDDVAAFSGVAVEMVNAYGTPPE